MKRLASGNGCYTMYDGANLGAQTRCGHGNGESPLERVRRATMVLDKECKCRNGSAQ